MERPVDDAGPPAQTAAALLPVVQTEDPAEPTVRVTEIFHSIQGESTHAGWPCVFVRLTGCNLRCRWCDTEYAFHGGERRSVQSVVDEVLRLGCRRVEITGGEPLLQKATPELARRLLARGLEVLCETSGERDIDVLPEGVRRIVDFKAPGSGECQRNDWANVDRLRRGDEVKIVVADRGDFEWAVNIVRTHDLAARVPVHFSPVYRELEPAALADWIVASGLDVRLNLQLHKALWGDVPGR